MNTSDELIAELNLRQQKFVRTYAASGNATQSAISAGYSQKTAKQQAGLLLTKLKIKAALDAYKSEQAIEQKITASWVLGQLVDNAARAIEAGDLQSRNRSLELISRWTGGFHPTQRIEHSGSLEKADVGELETYLRGQGIDPEAIIKRVLN